MKIENHQANFLISQLAFGLSASKPIFVSTPFIPFEAQTPADVKITFRQVSRLSEPAGTQVFRDDEIAVYESGNQYIRLYHFHGADLQSRLTRIYASVVYDWETGTGEVTYTPEKEKSFSDSKGCFAHMGFEDILMSRNRLALHASLIETPMGGILFSGVSGIGKSTQADLWHQYEGSTILNGDRPILFRTDGRWEAHGSPFAGSSHYYVNRSTPIRAIILLEQGSTCQLRRLGGMEAFCGLYAGTTINVWNKRYVARACDLLENLANEVPVYHYCCTPDEQAVRVLKAELLKGGG